MNLLKLFLLLLDRKQLFVHESYLYSMVKTGESHTITTDGEKLIVTGSRPKGPRFAFSQASACAAHLREIGSAGLVCTPAINRP